MKSRVISQGSYQNTHSVKDLTHLHPVLVKKFSKTSTINK